MCNLTLSSSSITKAALNAFTVLTLAWLIDTVSDLEELFDEPFLVDFMCAVLTEKICRKLRVA